MIFYTKARFCTDLSGDRLGASLMPGAYKTITSHPLGLISQPYVSQRASSLTEPRGPMDTTPMEVDSDNGSRTTSSVGDFGFSPAALLANDSSGSDSHSDLVDFEVSGLGGVQPDDNFTIRVRRSQTQTAPSGPAGRRRSSAYPKKILEALSQTSSSESAPSSPVGSKRIIKEKIISASRKTLPTSALPPASFLPFNSTSSSDSDSELDSDVSSDADSEADSESGDGPVTALQILNVSPGQSIHDSDSDEASEYSEDSDDGSVDFLATARQLDPNTIRNQEREYDAAIADRLAEEIVAGSSAATAGGGSGFNSPAGPTKLKSEGSSGQVTSGSMSERSRLKRSRTSDSLALGKTKSRKTNE
jgi:hypothetical protein